MNLEHLLRDAPTVEEWAATRIDLDDLTPMEIERIEGLYSEEFAVSLPAFDDDGWPTMPPDHHVIDAFARAWIPEAEDAALLRAAFGTVAVIAERIDCDVCSWAAARYESRVGSRRDFANLCLSCLVQRGDPVLGSGHSVMVLLPDEIPNRILDRLVPYLGDSTRQSWTRRRHGDGWDGYRRWGFTGPDETGSLYATILNVQLSVRLGPLDSVEFTTRRAGVRTLFAPGNETHYAPRSQDELDVRAILKEVVGGRLATRRRWEERALYFAVGPAERDERAMRALERQGGEPWLTLGGHRICDSGDYEMSLAAAKESENSAVLGCLALSHPDPEIRRAAIANPALESGVLAQAAAGRDTMVIGALLERDDLPGEATAQIVETLLLAGALNQFEMLAALKRPDFPDQLLETAVQRLSSGGTQARLFLAEAIHEAPVSRRDLVHLQLLRKARKIKSTVDLVDAVVGMDAARAAWLVDHEEWKIRDLMSWWDQNRKENVQLAPPSAAGKSTVQLPEASTSPPAAVLPDLAPPAISARLRRWWLREAMFDGDLVASDIGDALRECRLLRTTSELRVNTPYDFGSGQPIPTKLERRFAARIGEISGGAVDRIAWSFIDGAKPTTRKRSSDVDVYEPGDPLFEEWSSAVEDLSQRLVRGADGRALAALRNLRLAGVSRHRVWLSAPSAEAVRAIGTTPGAAAALKIAVAGFQNRKPAEALYAVVADPDSTTPRLHIS